MKVWIGSSSTEVTPSDLMYSIDFIGQTFIGAAPFLRHFGVELGIAAQMELVNDGVLPWNAAAGRRSPFQSKFGSTTTHFGMKGALSRSSKVVSSPDSS